MPSPYLDAQKIGELVALEGRAKVSFPYDDTSHRKIERVQKEPLTATGTWTPVAYGTADQQYASCILTGQTLLSQDDQEGKFYRVWEDLPGPVLTTSRIDPEDGSVITESRQTVLASTAGPVTAIGTTTTRYEPRGDSSYVSIKITTTTALDGVVRSAPTRVNLKLPRVLAGIAVSYNVNKGTGSDTSTGVAGGTGTRHVSASARSNSSLGVIPEVYLPIRDNSDLGEDFPAFTKQVFLSGAITEAAILAKLTTVYEVVVNGTLSPAAGGTYLGNSSNSQGVNSADGGVIWFSLGNYVLQWQGGNWLLGTRAGIAAGNFWFKAGSISDWLGAYAAVGANTGTAHVAAGRTVQAWPRWNTQEVNLVTAGKQVSVSSNASASEEDGTATSLTLSSGVSVSVGGSQSRVRVEPTLHGAITIAKSTYNDSVNATATAAISGLGSTGINSGFPSGTKPYGNAQFVTSYVRFNAAPSTATPTAIAISGNTIANPTIVHTATAHGFITGQQRVISGSNSTPSIDGLRTVTVTDSTHFSVAVNVSGAGTSGTVQPPDVVTATFIPATDPADVPYTEPYMLPGFEVTGKDAIYFTVHATVVDMVNFLTAPTFISYSDPAPTYYQGLAIVANQPYFIGGPPASYAISPGIPAGLAFNTTTGIITGSPSSGQAATSYTVTATNGSGSTTTTITITVSI